VCHRRSEIAAVQRGFSEMIMPINESMPFRRWIRAKGFSLSTGYKMKNAGLAPKLLEVPGIRTSVVTPEADAEWEARMSELAQGEAAQLEVARRKAQAAEAGRIAAMSPRHHSRRQVRGRGRRRAG
jgi:hypothetical protein